MSSPVTPTLLTCLHRKGEPSDHLHSPPLETHPNSSMSVLCWKPWSWMQHSRWDLRSRGGESPALTCCHASYNTAQDIVSFLDCKCTLPADSNKIRFGRNYTQSGCNAQHHSKGEYLDRWPIVLKWNGLSMWSYEEEHKNHIYKISRT